MALNILIVKILVFTVIIPIDKLHASWNSEVRVEVSDHGEGFTPAPRFGTLDEPGGFGLFLIGRLADRWGVDTEDGTTVWFVLRR